MLMQAKKATGPRGKYGLTLLFARQRSGRYIAPTSAIGRFGLGRFWSCLP
jgi:hypothetical protein